MTAAEKYKYKCKW